MVSLISLCALACLLFVVHAAGPHNERKHLKSRIDEADVDRLEAYLFPNRTSMIKEAFGRRLAIEKPAYDPNTKYPCSYCKNMKNCRILDLKMLQETYLPKDTNAGEICKVVESLAERLAGEVFGDGRAFRDTPDCRDMVMQYLCLFIGGDSSQYTNYCLYDEQVFNVDSGHAELAPYPPCRSFCVQVATTCANDPTFIHTCARIPCPPENDLKGRPRACTPDPRMGGYGNEGDVLAANIGCEVPYYRTPYNAASRAFSLNVVLLCVCLLVGALWLL